MTVKILHLSDLHRYIDPMLYKDDKFRFNTLERLNYQDEKIKEIIDQYNPDIVAITGDIFEDSVDIYRFFTSLNRLVDKDLLTKISPNTVIRNIIPNNIPVVYCLGNHEFFGSTIKYTLDVYKNAIPVDNVYCLDVCGHIVINDVNFVGNVLWYDGTCSERPDSIKLCQNIDKSWGDCTIINFNPLEECSKCIEQIKKNISSDYINVLLTHEVPHIKLNAHNFSTPFGIYNSYSGVRNLFEDHDINVQYSLCGHTHRPAKAGIVYQDKLIECYNCGNDFKKFNYLLIDVETDNVRRLEFN
mgnify:CR=1 FL=1